MSRNYKYENSRSLTFLVGIAVFGLLLASSGWTDEGKQGWQVDWEKTVQAAKKEGRLYIYGSSSPMSIIQAGVFQKTYPEIKIVTVSPGRSSMAYQRLMTERRAGRYLADLFVGGSTTIMGLYRGQGLDPIKPLLIQPEVLDESKWLNKKHAYLDPEGQYVFIYIAHPQPGSISYNTKLIDPTKFNSFWDFLNPELKGKIEVGDVRSGGTGSSNLKIYYYHPQLGPKYIKRLVRDMDITLFRNRRQSVDWLANGRFSICFFCYPRELAKAQKQGLPVEEFGYMKEGAGLTSHSGQIGLVNKAPHPNAAKVFVNWLLSREGQMTMQTVFAEGRRGASNSRRIDIPKDMIPPQDRLKQGVDYIDVETPERRDMRPIIKVFKEALAEKRMREKR